MLTECMLLKEHTLSIVEIDVYKLHECLVKRSALRSLSRNHFRSWRFPLFLKNYQQNLHWRERIDVCSSCQETSNALLLQVKSILYREIAAIMKHVSRELKISL
ncbi:hypothetical protein CEXT_97921 [Caerostris extrusa]|uniref:Maturase K n=1 Tax=Caerostris extrusa TaxID=172846 RepID=A0AAV4V7Q8_CAEEX|nr:hypothetical protein CEXT_97921 [Caerostris extrusa]